MRMLIAAIAVSALFGVLGAGHAAPGAGGPPQPALQVVR